MPGADGKSSLKSKGSDFDLPKLEDSVTPDTIEMLLEWTLQIYFL